MSLIHRGLSVDVRMRSEAQSIHLHLGSDCTTYEHGYLVSGLYPSSSVQRIKAIKTQRFGDWICLRPPRPVIETSSF
jgi:hypothetical protein